MYKIRSIKQIIFNKCATNLKTIFIYMLPKAKRRTDWAKKNLWTLMSGCNRVKKSIFFKKNFHGQPAAFQLVIDNVIMRPEQVTRTPTNGSAVLLSRVSVCITWPVYCTAIGHVIRTYILHTYKYTFWYNFDTVLCQFLETRTSDRCLKGIVQLLRFSGISLYPHLIFPLQSL